MIHAITATWAFDEARKQEALTRRCLKCRRSQRVSEEKINEPVACDACGAEIPPKSAANRQLEENERKEQNDK